MESKGDAEVITGIPGSLIERLFELNLRMCPGLSLLILSLRICVSYIHVLKDVCACVHGQVESRDQC